MITIDNKYKYGHLVEYRIWDVYTQEYSYYKGNIVGIDYTDLGNKPMIKYGIIRENKWESKEEIEALGATSDFEYFNHHIQKYPNIRCNVAIEWVNEEDIIGKIHGE